MVSIGVNSTPLGTIVFLTPTRGPVNRHMLSDDFGEYDERKAGHLV
ncbi:hypothetical protein [Natrinema halophilum]|uniref:Uncharacterized protein n=1 Tax=Natrinema halophilum TaxID=1699371 RepID=A0A7D5L012_9EURY|nr:hypothetical protein [Natrinema halophilum]QLG50620.1 hypothetical protein HYG82_18145 [Natrinema halophilum]